MTPPFEKRPNPSRGGIGRLRPDDFRRLGLDPTEARVNVIRRAACQLATPLLAEKDPSKAEASEAELALLVTSVYRLLDPRRREQLIERVQLLRAEPTPLRSHLLESRYKQESPSTQTETNVEEEYSSRSDTSEHDWMIESLAELRIEPLGKRRQGGIRGDDIAGLSPERSAKFRQRIAPRRTQRQKNMLEIARFINSGEKRLLRSFGVTGIITLLVAGMCAALFLGWYVANRPNDRAEVGSQPQIVASPSSISQPETGLKNAPSRPRKAIAAPSAENAIPAFDPAVLSPDSEKVTPAGSEPMQENSSMFPVAASPEIPPTDGMSVNEETSNNLTDSALDDSALTDSGANESIAPADSAATQIFQSLALPIPTERLDEAVRHPLPPVDATAAAKQKIIDLGLAGLGTFPTGTSTVVELWAQNQKTEAGSADRLALGYAAGERAILVGNPALALVVAAELSSHFNASPEELATVFLADAESNAVTRTEHERVTLLAMLISDAAIKTDQFDIAAEAVRLGTLASVDQPDSAMRARLRQRRDAIVAAQRIATTYFENKPADVDTIDKGLALNIGRYFCINRRVWKEGLPWLAAGSDSRLAALASDELAILQAAAPNDLAGLARRWIEFSERRKGRDHDSIRLHAAELLRQASNTNDVLVGLELKKELTQLEATLPEDLIALDLDDAKRLIGGQVVADQPLVSRAELLSKPSDPQSVGLLGRLVVAGLDTGIVYRYPTHIALPISTFTEMLGRANVAPGPFRTELHGYLQLDVPTTIRISAKGPISLPTNLTAGMNLAIGNVNVPLQDQGEIRNAVLDVPAGMQRVVWQVSGEQFETLQLLVRDDRTGQILHLRHDQVAKSITEQLPVRFPIDFQVR